MKKEVSFVTLENARKDGQLKVMQKIAKNQECPFCLKNIKKYHKHPIIKSRVYWIVTKNQWPYDNTFLHLLLIFKKHATKLSELDSMAGYEFFELLKWIGQKYKIRGGVTAMRFGNPKFSSSTVNHLHIHLIIPKISDKDHKKYVPVKFKIV